MTAREFYDAVIAHPDLEWRGVIAGYLDLGDVVIVRYKSYPMPCVTVMPVIDIVRCEWARLERILTVKEDPIILKVMSRIVGYFSIQRNWNGSKLAEARDRRIGDYAIRKDIHIDPVVLPEIVVQSHARAGAEMKCDLTKKEEEVKE